MPGAVHVNVSGKQAREGRADCGPVMARGDDDDKRGAGLGSALAGEGQRDNRPGQRGRAVKGGEASDLGGLEEFAGEIRARLGGPRHRLADLGGHAPHDFEDFGPEKLAPEIGEFFEDVPPQFRPDVAGAGQEAVCGRAVVGHSAIGQTARNQHGFESEAG